MTRQELLSYSAEDINKMNKAQLLELAKAEQKNLKDAMRRLRQSELDTPALKQFEKVGNVQAKKNMTAGELKREVMKGQVMLRYKTGTVGTAKASQAAMKEGLIGRLSSRLNVDNITEDESKAMWKVIARMQENAETKALLDTPNEKYIPKETQQKVYEIMKTANTTDPDKLQYYTEGVLDNVFRGNSFSREIENLQKAIEEGTDMQLYKVD